ncbi:MAG TPA: hypothetical protein VF163_06610, partial [Micromonosporaceae bacterium]
YIFGDNGTPFDISRGYHLHIYGANANGSSPKDSVMGTHASSSVRGRWFVEDQQPSIHQAGSDQYLAIGDSTKVCARIARPGHALVLDDSGDGTYHTGNCVPITRT